MAENLLLISNSTLHGSGYLDHCEKHIVVGLKERAMLHVVGNDAYLKGSTGARIFQRG